MRLTDAYKLFEKTLSHDPAVADRDDDPLVLAKLRAEIIDCIDYCDRQIQNAESNIAIAEECMNNYKQAQAMFEKLLACCKGAENDT